MLNYRQLCSYSETEKWLVISALEVKYFSNGTCDSIASLQIEKKDRQKSMTWNKYAGLVVRRGPPSQRDVYGHCPVPSLFLYHLRMHTWGKAANITRLSQSLSILFWGKGYLTDPAASWFSQHSSWMSLREPLVSASLPLRLQTWAAAPGSLCLFSVGARYLTQVILLACQTLYWVFPQAANLLLFSYFTDKEVDILRAQAGQLVRGSIETGVKTSDLRTVFHPSCYRTSIPAEHFSAYYNSGWF